MPGIVMVCSMLAVKVVGADAPVPPFRSNVTAKSVRVQTAYKMTFWVVVKLAFESADPLTVADQPPNV